MNERNAYQKVWVSDYERTLLDDLSRIASFGVPERPDPFLNRQSATHHLGLAQYCLTSAHQINDPEVLRTCLGDAIIQIGRAMDLINMPDDPVLDDDGIEVEFTDELDDEELRGVELRSHHVE